MKKVRQVYPWQEKSNTRSSLRHHYPLLTAADVPRTFWCGHFLDPEDRSIIIPDGAGCCFWHWVGLPRRWNKRHPCYPWQEQADSDYDKYDYIYMRKPPKVGATNYYLKKAMHQACTNPLWANGQVAIVVGTRGNEAEKMIERCKEILAYKDHEGVPIRDEDGHILSRLNINQEYNNKKEFSLNSVEFRAHPADNIDSIRSQPNMVMIMIDEIAFFKMVDQQRVRDAFEHYIGGASVKIILITTAGRSPSGVGYEIEVEHPSIYKKYLYDVNIGLAVHPESMTSLYDAEEIQKLRGTISYNRNYLGQWGYGAGNIYDSRTLETCTSDYTLKDISSLPNCLSIDPAYGKVRDKLSSKFAGLGMYKENGKFHTRSYFELEEPSDEEALARVRKEIKAYGYKTLVCDGHWTGIIKTFSSEITTHGIVYSNQLQDMTENAQKQVNDLNVNLHFTHEELIRQLRAIKKDEKGVPSKKESRFDLGDCFQQGLWHFATSNLRIIKV